MAFGMKALKGKAEKFRKLVDINKEEVSLYEQLGEEIKSFNTFLAGLNADIIDFDKEWHGIAMEKKELRKYWFLEWLKTYKGDSGHDGMNIINALKASAEHKKVSFDAEFTEYYKENFNKPEGEFKKLEEEFKKDIEEKGRFEFRKKDAHRIFTEKDRKELEERLNKCLELARAAAREEVNFINTEEGKEVASISSDDEIEIDEKAADKAAEDEQEDVEDEIEKLKTHVHELPTAEEKLEFIMNQYREASEELNSLDKLTPELKEAYLNFLRTIKELIQTEIIPHYQKD